MSKCRAQSPSVHDRAICLNGLLTEKASCFSSPPTTRHMRYGTRDMEYYTTAMLNSPFWLVRSCWFSLKSHSCAVQDSQHHCSGILNRFKTVLCCLMNRYGRCLLKICGRSLRCLRFVRSKKKGNSSRTRTRTFPMQCIILYWINIAVMADNCAVRGIKDSWTWWYFKIINFRVITESPP